MHYIVRERRSGSRVALLFMLAVVVMMSGLMNLVSTASALESVADDQGDEHDGTCEIDGTCGNNDYGEENGDADIGSDRQSYIDDETGEVKYFDPTRQINSQVVNLSKFRVDLYWDDGKYGVNLLTLDANGGETQMNTFQGHKFFVTRHGVRENLYPEAVEGQKDEPLQFEIQKPDQKLVIPENAAPLSGDRAAKNRCVDRYAMCANEGKSQD